MLRFICRTLITMMILLVWIIITIRIMTTRTNL
nr:MAG TPA: hypothetical protein [Caudoviricetes sp.]